MCAVMVLLFFKDPTRPNIDSLANEEANTETDVITKAKEETIATNTQNSTFSLSPKTKNKVVKDCDIQIYIYEIGVEDGERHVSERRDEHEGERGGGCEVESDVGEEHGGEHDNSVEVKDEVGFGILSSLRRTWSEFRMEYHHMTQKSIVSILVCQFVLIFIQQTLETIITPITQAMYGWGELLNSIMYFVLGIVVIVGLVAISIICDKKSGLDFPILMFGFGIEVISLALSTALLHGNLHSIQTPLPAMCVVILLTAFGLAPLSVAIPSIFAKLLLSHQQGRSQGVLSAVISFGCILAPLWGGLMLSYVRIMFAVMLSVMTILACVMGYLWKCTPIFCELKKEEQQPILSKQSESIQSN
jgi:hypothetical protein